MLGLIWVRLGFRVKGNRGRVRVKFRVRIRKMHFW